MSAIFTDGSSTTTAARVPFRGRRAMDSKQAGSADKSLRRAVLAQLIAHPLVSTGHIFVAATAGGVTLSGYVTSNAQKCAAIIATRRVKGVEQVVDDLRVAVPCPDARDPPTEALEARPRVAAQLAFRAFERFDRGEINPGTLDTTMAEPSELRQAP